MRILLFVAAFIISAQISFGQAAAPELSDIPQPHLAKVRAEALEGNTWKFTDLITCYPTLDGLAAEQVLKDPGPAKVAGNFYFLGTGVVAAWAVDTSAGNILIDTLDNRSEVDRYIVGGMRKLGLDPARIKIIIVSHGHKDHYGGARYLQAK